MFEQSGNLLNIILKTISTQVWYPQNYQTASVTDSSFFFFLKPILCLEISNLFGYLITF